MKKTISIFCFLVIHLSAKNELLAQQKRGHTFSLGYGYKTDTKWWREVFDITHLKAPGKTNDITFNYEFDYKKNIVFGIEALLIDDFKDIGMFNSSEDYSYEAYVVRILPHVNYSLIKTKRFSFYGSFAAGFYYFRFKAIHTYPTDRNWIGGWGPFMADEVIMNKKQIGLDWAGAAGIKLFLTKNIGMFSEIGLHKSIFQIGIIIQTGK
jgi:hypothetical protein